MQNVSYVPKIFIDDPLKFKTQTQRSIVVQNVMDFLVEKKTHVLRVVHQYLQGLIKKTVAGLVQINTEQVYNINSINQKIK